jgi:hypothetical protein
MVATSLSRNEVRHCRQGATGDGQIPKTGLTGSVPAAPRDACPVFAGRGPPGLQSGGGQPLLEPDVLLLELFQPLGVVSLHAAVLVSPGGARSVRRSRGAWRPLRSSCPPPGASRLRRACGSPVRAYAGVVSSCAVLLAPSRGIGLTQRVDYFKGGPGQLVRRAR